MAKQSPWETKNADGVPEIERYHGIIVAIGGIQIKSPSLPDWNLSYVQYPTGKMKEFRQVLMKEHVRIIRVTDQRIYFEQ